MFGQCEAVGHPGDEVANPPCALGFAVPAGGRQPFGRQVARDLLVAREQIEQDLLGIAHYPHHPRMPVHPQFQERLDVGLGLRDVSGKCDQHLAMVADIVDRCRARCLQALTRLRDDRADQMGNQFAHQFRATPVVIEARILPGDFGDHFRGQRHDLEIVDGKQPGAQAVVDVVGVIGNVVGDRRDLRLQRGEAPKFQVV